MELSRELQEQVRQWCRQQTGAATDSPSEPPPEDFYRKELAVAPGWKVGGWPGWGRTDPSTQSCPACGTEREPLLTIASAEWDASSRSWIPYEDQAHADTAYVGTTRPQLPSMIQIGDMDRLQFYACPASPDHPHTERVQ
jgi:hypothetical protein